MICTSKNQALRIAQAGAAKMTTEDYTLFAPEFDAPTNVWFVAKNDGETTYRVELNEKGEYTCNCRFFEDNAQFASCKHGEYVLIEKETVRRADAMSEIMDDPEVIEYMRGTGVLPR